jgi:hypothetical protein
MAINTKVHRPFDAVLKRLGFEQAERVYTKYLGISEWQSQRQ